jgi:hypothetical protein
MCRLVDQGGRDLEAPNTRISKDCREGFHVSTRGPESPEPGIGVVIGGDQQGSAFECTAEKV